MGRFITADPSLILNPAGNIPYLLPAQLPHPLELHPYLYVANNPVNFVDPWGLCGKKKDPWANLSWWEKLEKGYYYGTALGEEAAYWYAQRAIDPTNKWYQTVGYWVGGLFASLWTPETYQATAWTLVGAKLFVYKGTPTEPIHYGFDLPGARNIIHYGVSRWGRHIGIWFKGPYKAWKHIYFKSKFPFFRIWP